MQQIQIEQWDDGRMLVNEEFAELLRYNNVTTAEALWKITSVPVKNVRKERGTERTYLEPISGTDYVECYIKRYQQIPLKDKLEAIVSLKQYDFDAWHEWDAVVAFHRYGLKTMQPVAVGRIGKNSCLLTLGIQDYIRASELFGMFTVEERARRRRLIGKIADYAGNMHTLGMAHQDFYLVHMFIKEAENDELYLIDLQRVLMQDQLARRWRVKDLGELLFSALHCVTRQDIMFFWKRYCGIVDLDPRNRPLLMSVIAKAEEIRKRSERKRKKAK